MEEILEFSGLIRIYDYGEAEDLLFLSSLEKPLARELEVIHNKSVSVRYWITEKECTKEDAIEGLIRKICGETHIELTSHYSDYTGYLWTDEYLNVGGHSFIDELYGQEGKWLILEIEVHGEVEKQTH